MKNNQNYKYLTSKIDGEKCFHHFFDIENFNKGEISRRYSFWFVDYMYAMFSSVDIDNFKTNIPNILKIMWFGSIYFLFPNLARLKRRKELIHMGLKYTKLVFDTYNIQPIKSLFVALLPNVKLNCLLYVQYKVPIIDKFKDYINMYIKGKKLKETFRSLNEKLFNKKSGNNRNGYEQNMIDVITGKVLEGINKKCIENNSYSKFLNINYHLNFYSDFKLNAFNDKGKYNDSIQIPFRIISNSENFNLESFVNIINKKDSGTIIPHHLFKTKFNVIFHIHGGGFLGNTSQQHQSYLSNWTLSIENTLVISIDYSLAPEYTLEQMVQESFLVYLILIQKYKDLNVNCFNKVIFAGDSAGCFIGMNMIKMLIKLNLYVPDGCLLIYPCVKVNIDNMNKGLINTLYDPVLDSTALGFIKKCVFKDPNKNYEGDFYNFLYTDKSIVSKFPRCEILVGTHDPIKDDNLHLHNFLLENNVNSNYHLMFYHCHGCMSLPPLVDNFYKLGVDLGIKLLKDMLEN